MGAEILAAGWPKPLQTLGRKDRIAVTARQLERFVGVVRAVTSSLDRGFEAHRDLQLLKSDCSTNYHCFFVSAQQVRRGSTELALRQRRGEISTAIIVGEHQSQSEILGNRSLVDRCESG